ncbi:AfsR/SARP family transcriptional regulator [Thermobifida halotolerans]|nr:winged helix-turn-helix domain-containing protein [Thermobifida halotolerans]
MLGPFELRDRDRHPVDLGGRRVAALVARLAPAPGALVSTDTLVAALWDGSSDRGGANAVQRPVSRARRVMREHGADDLAIVSRRGGYLLDVDPGRWTSSPSGGWPPLTEPPSFGWNRFDRLAAALPADRTLLVLDNCEYLVDEVAAFVHRLPGRCPGFAVDVDTAGAVVEICRRLDGLPLAIELAAARMRTMTAHHIADRLDDRFRLLSGGSRTSTARHRTLRAVLDWSWHLLEDAERTLARRLSVMVGDATAESAARVCAGADLAPDDVLYPLSSPAERSLVRVVEQAPGRPRGCSARRCGCAGGATTAVRGCGP